MKRMLAIAFVFLFLFSRLLYASDTVVFLGDSITAGGKWQTYFPQVKVFNLGIVGDRAEGVLDRLYKVVEKKPSKIFLMIGINNAPSKRTHMKILRYYGWIVQRLVKDLPESKIYIQSILPVNRTMKYKGRVFNKDVIDLNRDIAELARENSYEYIDLYKFFVTVDGLNKDYSYDGLHLNSKGYSLWVDKIKHYIYLQ